MFNLEQAIQTWKQLLKQSPAFEEGQIKEMETHLWDEIDDFMANGLSAEEAFNKAVSKFGAVEELSDEVYKTKTTKIDATPPWRQQSWVPNMLPNYIKVAFRNLKKDKLYSGINILGLAVGMACSMLIGWYIHYEYSYDTDYPQADNIYRTTVDVLGENRTDHFATSSPPMGPALKEAFPEVEQFTRLRDGNTMMVEHGEQRFYESNILYADSTFFDVFQLPLGEGDPATALRNPNSVVLSYDIARKYFPQETAVGKTLTLNGNELYTVTGVLVRKMPLMHLDLEIILPYNTFVRSYPEGEYQDWGWVSFYNYIRISENASVADLENKILDLVDQRAGEVADRIRLNLQPVQNIHLTPGRMGEIADTGNRTYIYILGIAALLILGISVFNFMNLASVRSARRGLEIGVRKVLGAHRRQLVTQYLGETVFQSLLSLLISILLIEGFLSLFGTLLLPGLELELTDYVQYLPFILILTTVVGILAGLYPALVLSRFEAVKAVKDQFKQGKRGTRIRNMLVIAQFSATIIFIISTLVVFNQLDYLRSKDLGFDKERVAVIPLNSEEVRQNFESLKRELADEPGIAGITAGRLALDGGYGTVSFTAEGHVGETIRMRLYPVYYDFTDILGMEMVEGRGFSEEFPADTDNAFIINEAAARMLGWEGEAVGKGLQAADYAPGQRQVVGVVKDFHYTPLHEEVAPLSMFVRRGGMHFMYVRLMPEAVSNGLQRVEHVWNGHLTDYPFDYWFLDDRLDNQYETEEQFSYLGRIFSVVAIVIACFGLFGLASFMAEQRRKEIGVRKVHGATISEIVFMMTKNFMKLVGISFVLAVPIAYVSVNQWLENFAYRIDVGMGIFLLAGVLALTISLLTVIGQAIRAARVNPVKSLRSE